MKALPVVACVALLAASLPGCGGPPKQVAPPTFLDSEGEDIAPEEQKELEPAAKMPDEMSSGEKKAACCEQCAKGLAADRTGQPPDQIPCADFTAVLEEFCLDFFRKSPLKASECPSAAPAEGETAPAEGEEKIPDAPGPQSS
ncbi:MAG: hypothetical protein JRI23_08725 [Deltaproteobacteria bacterium]|jgi:hypothetical protein|nr:hypothetical protein [Deltaproteobacteria bacterium]MBW2531699.1 hypothetical protein [Deltaproteobacteria bacterium]